MKKKLKIGLICKGKNYPHQKKWKKIISKFAEVKFICPNPPKNIFMKILYHIFFIKKVREKAKECDFILSLSFFPYGFWARYSGKKYIAVTFGSDILIQADKFLFKYIARNIIKNSSFVTYKSMVIYKKLIENLNCPFEKAIHVIPTPIVKKLKTIKIKNSIIFPRGKAEICNHETFEKAIKILKKKYPKCHVTHLKGIEYSHDEFLKILSKNQIFVSANRSDSLSSSLMEAMYYKLAPVCSYIQGNKELIINYHNGLLFATNEPKDLAEKLLFLLKNPKLIEKYGSNSKKIIKKIMKEHKPEKILEQKIKSVLN